MRSHGQFHNTKIFRCYDPDASEENIFFNCFFSIADIADDGLQLMITDLMQESVPISIIVSATELVGLFTCPIYGNSIILMICIYISLHSVGVIIAYTVSSLNDYYYLCFLILTLAL